VAVNTKETSVDLGEDPAEEPENAGSGMIRHDDR
jgi:hypothetical protein